MALDISFYVRVSAFCQEFCLDLIDRSDPRFLFYPTLVYAYVDQKRGDIIVDEAEIQAGGNGVGGRTILSGINYVFWSAARVIIFPKTLTCGLCATLRAL